MCGMTIGYAFVIVSQWSLPAPLVVEQRTLAAHLQVRFGAELGAEVETEVGVEVEERELRLEQGFERPEKVMFAPAVVLVL